MTTRRTSTCTFVVLLLVALLLPALGPGCALLREPVAVVGDSITALDGTTLDQQLGDSYRLSVSGNFGRTVAEVLPEATVVAQDDHDQVIINLGTNDVLRALPVEDSMAAMREMVDLFGSARCIHLVDINEHMIVPGSSTSRSAEAKAFNTALAELVKSDGRLSLIRWSEVTAATLDDQQPPSSTLTEDSIHPTAEGNTQLNRLYEAALAACP